MEGKIGYIYLGDGTKVAAKLDSTLSVSSYGDEGLCGMRYRGSFVYDVTVNGIQRLQSISLSTGRLVALTGTNGALSFEHDGFVTDHLGNVAAVVNLSASSSTSTQNLILEQNDYTPFGTRIEPAAKTQAANRWRYAGKEEQRIAGMDLHLIDFGARFYDPFICRWNATDPLAHKYFSMSPYNYCGNDPVNFFDPDGRTDFYNNYGELLFRDVIDNGVICVTSQEQIDKLRKAFFAENSIEKREELVQGAVNEGQTFTAALRNGVFKDNPEAALKIMQHYCETPFTLGSNLTAENNGPFMTTTTNMDIPGTITADLDQISRQGHYKKIVGGVIVEDSYFYDNYFNIKSSVDVHERFHVSDRNFDGPDKREARAYKAEMDSPLYGKCTKQYRENVEKEYKKYHNL